MKRNLRRTHPGLILKMELIEGRNLTVGKAAELLATKRAKMSTILNGHASISPNMALRIEQVFGGSADHYIRLQSAYDFEIAKEVFLSNPPKIEKYIDPIIPKVESQKDRKSIVFVR